MKNLLNNFGFGKKESEIYLVLLESGDLNISEIFRKTKINRVSLYKILPEMVNGGFVSETKQNNSKKFKAENPEKLEMIFQKNRLDFEKSIKVLKNIYSNKKERPAVRFLEGKNAIKHTFEDMVISSPKNSTIYRYSSRKTFGMTNKSESYYKLRDSKRIERKAIVSEQKAQKKKSKLERFVRVVPKEFDLFDDDVSQFIYQNRVAFIDHKHEISFIIESEKIARFQEKIFKLLYSKL
jgi:sugar-specific transcriptional regulator TrmB